MEGKYLADPSKVHLLLHDKKPIFQVKDKQHINSNIINIKKLYIDKRNQNIAKSATDILYDSLC